MGSLIIDLDKFVVDTQINALAKSAEGVRYNHFDIHAYYGGESVSTLPQLKEIIDTMTVIWTQLRRFADLIEQDTKAIEKKVDTLANADAGLGKG